MIRVRLQEETTPADEKEIGKALTAMEKQNIDKDHILVSRNAVETGLLLSAIGYMQLSKAFSIHAGRHFCVAGTPDKEALEKVRTAVECSKSVMHDIKHGINPSTYKKAI